MNMSIKVTFWGVRGSYPSPGALTARVGGNTPCVSVQAGNHLIILDAGTGLIGLGRTLVAQQQADGKPIDATLLFSHTHHDHTQGFPFFNPIYLSSTTLHVFGPRTLHEDLEQVLARAMLPPVFPVTFDQLPCARVMRNLGEGEMIILRNGNDAPLVYTEHRGGAPIAPDSVVIRFLRSHAHPQGVFIYRIEFVNQAVVYATDTEGYASGDQRLINFARGAGLLIHDAQYLQSEYVNQSMPKQGWGHSTWEMAAQVAQAAGVKQLALFHHEPEHDDATLEQLEKQAQSKFACSVLAREGMTIEL
ncbi:MAG: MBL fold metallo-hydrolase [Chloroflexi bacterium]|nr:MBL fold metallo-hydrolase [Chloroflexota bacterium]